MSNTLARSAAELGSELFPTLCFLFRPAPARTMVLLAIAAVQLSFHPKPCLWCSRSSTVGNQPTLCSHLSSPTQGSQADPHLCTTSWRPSIQPPLETPPPPDCSLQHPAPTGHCLHHDPWGLAALIFLQHFQEVTHPSEGAGLQALVRFFTLPGLLAWRWHNEAPGASTVHKILPLAQSPFPSQ